MPYKKTQNINKANRERTRTMSRRIDRTLLKRLIPAGLSDDQLCMALRISRATLWRARGTEEWQEQIKPAEDAKTAQVERSLYSQAMGYPVEELEYERLKLAEAKRATRDTEAEPAVYVAPKEGQPFHGMSVAKRKVKQIIPNVIATIFYLKNNMPDKYKDRWSEDDMQKLLSTLFRKPIELRGMAPDEMEKLAADARKILEERLRDEDGENEALPRENTSNLEGE